MKKYRKAKGLTGSGLAKQLNVSVGHISNIENGKKDIFNLRLLLGLSQTLDLPLEELLHFKPSEIKTLTIYPHKAKIPVDKTDDIPDKTISLVHHSLDILTTTFLDNIANYNYSDQAIKIIINHILQEFEFINELDSLKEDSPAI